MSRLRIAVLFSEFIYPYSRQTFAGIESSCVAHDIDLVTVVCGEWRDPDKSITMRNVLYDWIDPEDYDGFLIPFSSLGQHVTEAEFLRFLSPLLVKPHVFLGAEVAGHDSVIPDNAQGIADLLDHLIRVHQTKKVLFIRGPEHHVASNHRQEGLIRAGQRFGLPEGWLTVLSSFSKSELASVIVDDCLARNLIQPGTALVSVSEDVALALMQELILRGVSVPRDFIVCGTSDSPQSGIAQPSLTSVVNHHTTAARTAVGLLREQVAGRRESLAVRVPVEVVPRQSCGCLAIDDPGVLDPGKILDLALQRASQGEPLPEVPGWADRLAAELPGDRGRYFLAALEDVLARNRTQVRLRDQSVLFNHLHFFRLIGISLISDFDLAEVFVRLRDKLEIRHAYLSAYDPPGVPGGLSRVLRACRDSEVLDLPGDQGLFATRELIPKALRPAGRSTFIVEAVFHQDRHLGILAVEPARETILVLETIAAQIAGAMHNQFQRDQISRLVHYDSLTGLPNRRLFHDRLRQMVHQNQRSGLPFAVAYLDLDNFKQVNDNFGHEAGDDLLVEVAGLLGSSLREGDTVARLGGDEFVLLLPEAQTDEGLQVLGQRLLNLFREHFGGSVRFGRVSASIGIAVFPRHGETEAELLRNADEAMYRAKRTGRDAFVLFEPSPAL